MATLRGELQRINEEKLIEAAGRVFAVLDDPRNLEQMIAAFANDYPQFTELPDHFRWELGGISEEEARLIESGALLAFLAIREYAERDFKDKYRGPMIGQRPC